MSAAVLAVSLGALVVMAGCDKVPLLAPTGATISLNTPVSVLPVNGTTQITASVISSAGQAVHNGTTITFTSSLGSFQPSAQAQTLNGSATVTFAAGSRSGTASITATSGGANMATPPASGGTGTGTGTGTSTGTTTPTGITIKIGGAAASAITLNANPATVPSSGGNSTITATVLDADGNPLPGVDVTFTTTAGSLSYTTRTTTSSGQTQTTLTTGVKTTISATAGAVGAGASGSTSGTTTTAPSVVVDVNAAPTVTITPNTTTTPTIGQLVTFTLVVTPAATGGSAISDVELDFDDGNVDSLGALTTSSSGINVSHAYQAADTYLVKLTVTDATGQTISTSAPVTVARVVKITIAPTPANGQVHLGDSASFTVTPESGALPQGVTIETYSWDFGDGATQTGGSSENHTYVSIGSKTVTVTVTASDGSTGTASVTISVN